MYSHPLWRVLLALAPLLLTILFTWLVAEGHLGFGGGEKEILLALPLAIWSLVYLLCCLVLWWRRSALRRAIAISAALASGVVAAAWLVLLGTVWWKYR